jgi:hypothetical protein
LRIDTFLSSIVCAAISCSLVYSASNDALSVAQARPLSGLVRELNHRGYLVTYEEAPYDEVQLRAKGARIQNPGFGYLEPVWRPVIFHPPAAKNRDIHLAAEDVDALVGEYNRSGNPGQYAALRDGEYVHIIPSGRSVNGRMQEFDPILAPRLLCRELSRPGLRHCTKSLPSLAR